MHSVRIRRKEIITVLILITALLLISGCNYRALQPSESSTPPSVSPENLETADLLEAKLKEQFMNILPDADIQHYLIQDIDKDGKDDLVALFNLTEGGDTTRSNIGIQYTEGPMGAIDVASGCGFEFGSDPEFYIEDNVAHFNLVDSYGIPMFVYSVTFDRPETGDIGINFKIVSEEITAK